MLFFLRGSGSQGVGGGGGVSPFSVFYLKTSSMSCDRFFQCGGKSTGQRYGQGSLPRFKWKSGRGAVFSGGRKGSGGGGGVERGELVRGGRREDGGWGGVDGLTGRRMRWSRRRVGSHPYISCVSDFDCMVGASICFLLVGTFGTPVA